MYTKDIITKVPSGGSNMKKKIYIPIISACLLVVGIATTIGNGAALAQQSVHGKSTKAVCDIPKALTASCHSHIVTDASTNKPFATTSFAGGYTPTDIQSAYALPATPAAGTDFNWNGRTVAIVDAYDNPNAASDMLVYRQTFNLPLCATTSATPTVDDLTSCFFTKVNQTGQKSPMPAGNVGWGQEINLDVQAVSASCPSCKIVLVEANSNSYTDLGAGVNTAAALGADAISNSYGGAEFRAETSATYNAPYNHPGVAITVSTGDAGYGVQFPAASQYVTAIGGTTLTRDTSVRGWTESAWSGAGSGCSAYVAKPAFQPGVGSCATRTVADVSAVADPNTGLAVYDSYGSTAGQNWYVVGGTSLASPVVASVYALAGNTGGTASAIKYAEYPYAHTAGLNDVRTGSNGNCTVGRKTANLALCTAMTGYDGPTGLGSPNGLSAF
jgi:subtilase family serine protease